MIRTILLLAALAPATGCLIPFPFPTCGGGDYDCPDPDPVQRGVFEIDESDPVLDEGLLDVGEEEVVLAWTDEAGNRWEAVYAITDETPERR